MIEGEPEHKEVRGESIQRRQCTSIVLGRYKLTVLPKQWIVLKEYELRVLESSAGVTRGYSCRSHQAEYLMQRITYGLSLRYRSITAGEAGLVGYMRSSRYNTPLGPSDLGWREETGYARRLQRQQLLPQWQR